jgi:hypothetical protein
MKDAGGDGGTVRLVQLKLDNLLTYIEAKSGLANDDDTALQLNWLHY